MHCTNCRTDNPAQFSHCAECGLPLFLAVLKEIGEEGEIQSHYIFANGAATIGRHQDNTVVLHDPSLSRFHARIEYKKNKFFIQDLSSSNGVIVNDAKVRRREIRDFDRLTLGQTVLLFRTGNPAAATPTHHPLLQTQEEFLAAVNHISQRAKTAVFSNEVLEIAARFAIDLTRAERAVIFLYDNNRKLRPAAFHNVTHSDVNRDEFEVSRSSILEAENTGEMLIREECLNDPRYKHNQSVQALQLNTIICLPLKSSYPMETATIYDAYVGRQSAATQDQAVKGVLFGMLYLDSRRALKGLPQHRKAMLQVLADQVALTIENALLQKEIREKKQISRQIDAAKNAQQRLFPAPSFSHPRFEMAYQYSPAQQVGGDYVAFLPLSDTRFLFAVGDVVGKGLPAGLVVMTVHGGLYSEVTHNTELLTLTRHLDRLIYEYAQGKVFVTFFAGVLDTETMQFEYTNAGHNHPLLYSRASESWQELAAAGMPLGVNPDIKRAVEKIALQSGDLLTFYTDGITEARDAAKKQFSKDGLKKVLSSWLISPAEEKPPLTELVNAVFARVQHFTDYQPLEDDATLMAVAMK
jgi:sigma-B regulation protein RsbU (phosphoserine phosphatase)